MRPNEKAILRDSKGEHLTTLTPDEIKCYELRAQRGEVLRSVKFKKGRHYIVFRLKEVQPPVPPSDSRNSSCALTKADSEGLAGIGKVTRERVERWIGWGLIGA